MQARENILSKIRQALNKPVPVPFVDRVVSTFVFQPLKQDLEIEFAENFTKLLGRFSFCESRTELVQQLNTLLESRGWKDIYCKEKSIREILINAGFNNFNDSIELSDCNASITSCENLIARTGTIVLLSNNESGRAASVYAPIHICIAFTNQLVYDISGSLLMVKNKYENNLPSIITLATGPSRTADIEKTLVVGVHGPKEVFCFLLDE